MARVEQVFNYVGAPVDFIVPAGVTSVLFECWGATGGTSYQAGTPSRFQDRFFETAATAKGIQSSQGSNGSGYTKGTLAVTPGDVYHIYVGGNGKNADGGGPAGVSVGLDYTTAGGAGGWNGGGAGGAGAHASGQTYYGGGGGGGGGATDIRYGGSALTNRIMVAAGAGGAGGKTFYTVAAWSATANPATPSPPYGSGTAQTTYTTSYYISGGPSTGGWAGLNGVVGGGGLTGSLGGGGATHSAGGIAGVGSTSGGVSGTAGVLGIGGHGGICTVATAGNDGSYGGGGGGGGYYGGGGGANGHVHYGAGGGGGSNHVDGAFTAALSTGHAFPPFYRSASGYGGFAALTYQQPPDAPTFNNPLNADNVAANAALVVGVSFTSQAPGAVFASWDIRWRTSPAGSWTTHSGLPVVSGSGSYTIASGTFTSGTSYDIEARVTDSSGDVSDWALVTVAAVTPPATATWTSPVTGASLPGPFPTTVTWGSIAGTQASYEVQVLDVHGNVLYDSGEVTSATTSHSLAWTGGSMDGLTFRVRYKNTAIPGIWSGWASATGIAININPPVASTQAHTIDEDNGSVTFTITPGLRSVSMDIFRQDVTHSEAEIRVAAGIATTPGTPFDWTDYTPATRTLYRYRFRGYSVEGGFADL